MSPASACCLRSCRRRPTRSTSAATCRPFSVCRGRRHRNFFAQRLGQLRAADLHARTRLDFFAAQPGDCPVRAVGNRLCQQRQGDTQGRLTLHRRRARCEGGFQCRDTAFHEVAAPKPHRVFAHAEGLADLRAGPTSHRQQHRTRPIRLATVARTRQRLQFSPLCFGRGKRRSSGHRQHLQIGVATQSPPHSLVNPADSA